MSFFQIESKKIAIVTKEKSYTYDELNSYQFINEHKRLILVLCEETFETVSAYVSAMNSGHATMLLSKDTNKELLRDIIEKYEPFWIIGLKEFINYSLNKDVLVRNNAPKVIIHENLALLLSTSGTTGSQKFVRLSYENIKSNANSIIQYLQITENEKALLNLPLSYSYGMSILNSHLLANATVLLTNESVMQKSFWSFISTEEATSLAGVPFTYQMLLRIGFLKMDLPKLKTLTQAGGRLNEKLVNLFGEYAEKHNKKLYIMYGQTEAAPRMSYIPPEKVLEKAHTIGIPIPNGEFEIINDELIYYGENVMMGYAKNAFDLCKSDELKGVLKTGDTAEVDEDGYYTITGRISRFIKIFGLRINLDEIEKKLEANLPISLACTGSDDKLIIIIEDASYKDNVKEIIEAVYKLRKNAYKVLVMEMPYLPNGKVDYKQLKELG